MRDALSRGDLKLFVTPFRARDWYAIDDIRVQERLISFLNADRAANHVQCLVSNGAISGPPRDRVCGLCQRIRAASASMPPCAGKAELCPLTGTAKRPPLPLPEWQRQQISQRDADGEE